jgi:mannose-6-phosphate isomerase-like protein (cupin superfamily)
MNAAEIIAELKELHPGARIKQLPEENPTEIVCEFDPRDGHSEWSLAVAIIDKSAPHFHKRIVETYTVIRGELKLHVGNEEHTMYEGQSYHITPPMIHWAEGDACWVEVYCAPGYTSEDHHLVEV